MDRTPEMTCPGCDCSVLPLHHDLLRPVLKKVLIHCKVELRDRG